MYRITEYDLADRDEHGHYNGAEDVVSGHRPVEATQLAVIAAFVEAAGLAHLTIREPAVAGFVHFGGMEGHGSALSSRPISPAARTSRSPSPLG
ncbi:hypothetical protein [Streptomyces sp. NBC_00083]|uniref:hypothetical protein n=1 Tax=Streptomyces sp. NBC_00083 TaxID=2975647 RepID=UPI00224C9130|nr:hypothetical protein [Streptomyces sp. NBC_00083]MCX5384782.1 hypothetical protein [Streptomyces sp. NBC_00083]